MPCTRLARWGLTSLLVLLAACSDAPAHEDAGTGGDATSQPDAGPGAPDAFAIPNAFVESYLPVSPPAARLNQKISVVFAPSAQAEDHIVPESVEAEVDGQRARLLPYLGSASGNRELRFVPFPVWTPGAEITVQIAEGVRYSGSGQSMVGAFAWTFRTEDTPFDERFDPGTTAGLTDGETTLVAAGGDTFTTADIVNDWQSPASTLYLLSAPVDPGDPTVQALAAKLRDSLAAVMGVGLAAPQIGINRRLFGASLPGREAEAYIDPVIVDWSRDEIVYWMSGVAGEGCLSIPGISAQVARPQWITVDYYTADGTEVKGDRLEADTAVVFLHEYDHLNGILITDRQEQK